MADEVYDGAIGIDLGTVPLAHINRQITTAYTA